MRTRTSPGPGTGIGRSSRTSGASNDVTTAALTFFSVLDAGAVGGHAGPCIRSRAGAGTPPGPKVTTLVRARLTSSRRKEGRVKTVTPTLAICIVAAGVGVVAAVADLGGADSPSKTYGGT